MTAEMFLFLLLYYFCINISSTAADFGDPSFVEAGDPRVTQFDYDENMKTLSLYLDEGTYVTPVPIVIVNVTNNEKLTLLPNTTALGANISYENGAYYIFVANSQDYEGLSETIFNLKVELPNDRRYLRINIKDIDDTPPVISLNGSSCKIKETTENGTGCVHTVTDTDTKLEDITLKVLELDVESSYFALKLISKTADDAVCQKNCGHMELIVIKELNFGITPVYSLMLQAMDLGDQTANISYIVEVGAVNKYVPDFSEHEIYINVEENTAGFIQFSKPLYAEDSDSGTFGLFMLELEDHGSGYSEPFIVIPSQAYQKTEVKLAVSNPQKLNYENDVWQNFSFAIVAKESANYSRASNCEIKITLIDVNDESPIFPNSEYVFNVTENQPIGAYVGNVQATDNDTGDIVSHYLGSEKNFLIEKISGNITVNAVLDYEIQKELIVTVIAEDTAEPLPHTAYATARIIITDLNDEKPQISMPHSQPKVKETTKKNEFVDFTLNAIDVDTTADLDFKIMWENSSAFCQGQKQIESVYINSFEIVTTSLEVGNVEGRLIVKRELDWSSFDTLYAVIEVEDRGTEPEYYHNKNAYATLNIIIVDENNHEPKFITSTLDNMEVYENAQNNTLIGTISAEDKDGPPYNVIKYSLNETGSTPFDCVYINSKNGEIRVSNTRIDFESNRFLTYIVRAADMNFTTNATLNITVIDVNDNTPQPVGNYSQVVDVPEDLQNKEWIFQVNATDADTIPAYRSIYYVMDKRFEDHSIFGINRHNGIIFVNNTGFPHLDYEGNPPDRYYELDITIADNEMANDTWESNKNIVKVRINVTDVNDNPPVLMNVDFIFNTSQETKEGNLLGKVTATDIDSDYNDNNYVWFKILNSSLGEDYFSIISDPQHQYANIFANRPFNNCTSDVHTIDIFAYNNDDRHQTDTRSYKFWLYDINQHSPAFIYPSMLNMSNISAYVENIVVNDELIEILVYDEDEGVNGTVRCEIIGDSFAKQYLYIFQNDTYKSLRLQQPVSSIKDLPFKFQVKIKGEDSCENESARLSTIVEAQVIFRSIVPSEPIFYRNTAVMDFIENSTDEQPQQIPVQASYPDDESDVIYYNIFNRSGAAVFKLDSETYMLSLKEPQLLDREETEFLYIIIVASRERTPPMNPNEKSLLNITIHVLDIIDVAPKFEKLQYSGAIKYGNDIGKKVFTVSSYDPDLNDSVVYSIKENSILVTDESLKDIVDPFKFKDSSSELLLNFKIKSSSISGYFYFVIVATDKANLMDEAKAQVYIITEEDTVTFTFYNNISYVTWKSPFIVQVFTEVTGINCNIEDIKEARDDTNLPEEDVTDVTMLFINLNSSQPVEASKIISMLSLQTQYYELKTKLVSEYLLLSELKAPNPEHSDQKTTEMVLILVTAVIGTLFIVVVAIFFYRTARLNRRLEALSTTRFGSQESGLNRAGIAVPNTNQHAVEGSNPVFGNEEITDKSYDTISQSSGDSDLIGIEENPEFNQHGVHHENILKSQSEKPAVERRVSLNPLSATTDLQGFDRRDSINPLASKSYEEYEKNSGITNSNFSFMQRQDSSPTTEL